MQGYTPELYRQKCSAVFEHVAPPHFHVRYEDFRAIVGIEPLV